MADRTRSAPSAPTDVRSHTASTRCTLAVAFSVFLVTASATASIVASDAIFDTALGRGYFLDVMLAASFGYSDTERAAFIVERADGSLGCLLWPALHLFDQEAFHGAIPAGTLAIVHTHPVSAGERPSNQDQREAERLGVPIYVLSLRGVYKASPQASSSLPIVRGEFWFRRRAPEGQTAHCQPMR
jgi:hypothetical protein